MREPRHSRPTILVLACAATIAGCGSAEPALPPIDKVLLISVDTLRADYLGTYNEVVDFSPNIDAFAEQSAVFTDAIAQSTSTLPSHTALFYSLHTFVHEAYFGNPPKEILLETPLDTLRGRGWATGAYVGGGQLRQAFGFNRGFDVYDVITTTYLRDHPPQSEHLQDLLSAASGFLEQHREDPFFLFVHNYAPHYPHFPPERFLAPLATRVAGLETESVDLAAPIVPPADGGSATQADYLAGDRRLKYAALVRYVDEFVGNLLGELDRLGLSDEVLVVFTADHGDSHGERDHNGHGLFYEEILRVPLIVRWPGKRASRIDLPVELNDVMPTLFTAAGIAAPYDFMGTDLTPVIDGTAVAQTAERIRISENEAEPGSRVALTQGQWKVVFVRGDPESVQLFDLSRDPGEQVNVVEENPAKVAELIQHYRELRAEKEFLQSLFPHEVTDTQELDAETLRELRALGYIQ